MAKGSGSYKGNFRSFRFFLFERNGSEFRQPLRTFFYALRFVWMTLEDFVRNRCTQKSAALAFTSVLSLFPLMAIVSICATFFYQGGPVEAENLVVHLMGQYVLPTEPLSFPMTQPTQPSSAPDTQPASSQSASAATAPSDSLGAIPLTPTGPADSLDQSVRQSFRQFRRNATRIAGLGSIGLLLASMALFTACEIFFNQIWKVHVRRPLFKRFSAFSAALVSFPILITAGTLVTHVLKDKLEFLINSTPTGPLALWFTTFATVAAPLLFVWASLTLAIKFIPNTRVNWMPALAGGLATAFLWLAVKHLFFSYIGLTALRKSVFEAFGATLVFLVWLYFLWAVILIGVEVAYLAQNFDVVLREEFKPEQEILFDPRLYVLVLGRIAQAFYRNEGGIRFDELRKRTNLGQGDLEDIVDHLQKKHLVAAREDDRLIIDRPLENLKLAEVFSISCSGSKLAEAGDPSDPVWKTLWQMDKTLPEHFGQMTMKDLLQQSGEIPA